MDWVVINTVNVHEAKRSEWLDRIERGELVLISYRKRSVPKRRSVSATRSFSRRPIGLALGPGWALPSCLEPMDDQELTDWYARGSTDPL